MPLKSESNHGIFKKDIGRNLCLVRTLSVPQYKPCWQLPPLPRIQAAFDSVACYPNFLGINVHMDLFKMQALIL